MAKNILVGINDIREKLLIRYRNNHKKWIKGDENWPISFPLGIPNEEQAARNITAVQEWQVFWHDWKGDGLVTWVDRHWSRLGMQRLPERLIIESPIQVARWIGEDSNWQRACDRYQNLIESWPALINSLQQHFELLASYSDMDFERLHTLLVWLQKNRDSGLYIRQLPIAGLDSKWFSKRKKIVANLFCAINSLDQNSDLYQLTGILREPATVRFRLLDSILIRQFSGVSDASIPVSELNKLDLPIKTVFIVENSQTGLAFTELPGAMVIMGLGYSVDLLKEVKWLKNLPCYYWGDIDTHGFVILDRLRRFIPNAISVLMNKDTLMQHKPLWGIEEKQSSQIRPGYLSPHELELYIQLKDQYWGKQIRLEQERIPWDFVWREIGIKVK